MSCGELWLRGMSCGCRYTRHLREKTAQLHKKTALATFPNNYAHLREKTAHVSSLKYLDNVRGGL